MGLEVLAALGAKFGGYILAAVGALLGWLALRGHLIRKGQQQAADKISRELLDKSVEAHEKAEDIRQKEAERAKAGGRPDADYPGGVQRPWRGPGDIPPP